MSGEVWATYAVKDHLDPGALAADIMLFDRLVFPVPEVSDLRFEEADPTSRGPVVWSRNPAEWERWERNGWEPDAQHSLLERLKPVVRKVPWDTSHQEAWRKEYAKAAEDHLPGYAFTATKTVLTRDLPAHVTGVEAMGPAYRSLTEIEQELGVGKKLAGSALSAVLGWKFLVPEGHGMLPEALLAKTVEFVTGDAAESVEFRDHRTKFWGWQQQYLKSGVTDRESIQAAVLEMQRLLEKQNAAASKLTLDKGFRYAFRIAPPTLGLIGLAFGPLGAVVGAAAGAFLSFVEVGAEEWVFKTPQGNDPSPAAFVLDVQRHFGWK